MNNQQNACKFARRVIALTVLCLQHQLVNGIFYFKCARQQQEEYIINTASCMQSALNLNSNARITDVEKVFDGSSQSTGNS